MANLILNGRSVSVDLARDSFIKYAIENLGVDGGVASLIFVNAIRGYNPESLDYLEQAGIEILNEGF